MLSQVGKRKSKGTLLDVRGLDQVLTQPVKDFLWFSEDSQLPVLVKAGAVPGVPDREDTAGSVIVKPPVLGPQEQVTLSAKTSSNLQ